MRNPEAWMYPHILLLFKSVKNTWQAQASLGRPRAWREGPVFRACGGMAGGGAQTCLQGKGQAAGLVHCHMKALQHRGCEIRGTAVNDKVTTQQT